MRTGQSPSVPMRRVRTRALPWSGFEYASEKVCKCVSGQRPFSVSAPMSGNTGADRWRLAVCTLAPPCKRDKRDNQDNRDNRDGEVISRGGKREGRAPSRPIQRFMGIHALSSQRMMFSCLFLVRTTLTCQPSRYVDWRMTICTSRSMARGARDGLRIRSMSDATAVSASSRIG